MDDKAFNIKLISEFNSSATGQSIVEWIEKVKFVYVLYLVKTVKQFFLLQLTCGAFVVYQQLGAEVRTETDMKQIKSALLEVFAIESFIDYEKFNMQCLDKCKMTDVYLAQLS